jgi:hypothetical protein
MGTWGAGPFGSDSALDFLDSVTALPVTEREAAVRRVLDLVAGDPSALFRDVVPEEVIAGAALVAAAMPAADRLPWRGDEAAAAARLAAVSDVRLPATAVRALDVVTAPGGWWERSWTDAADRAAALADVRLLREVLGGPAAPPAG